MEKRQSKPGIALWATVAVDESKLAAAGSSPSALGTLIASSKLATLSFVLACMFRTKILLRFCRRFQKPAWDIKTFLLPNKL